MRIVKVLLIVVVLAVVVAVNLPGWLCLVEGTPIQTPEGVRLVESLVPGDTVLSLAPDGRTVPATVVAVRKSTAFSWRRLTLADDRFLDVTSTHPIGTSVGWTAAGDLRGGALVRTSGGHAAVVRNEMRLGIVTVHDLSVEPSEMFLAGGVLVHNKSIRGPESKAIGDIRTMIEAQSTYAFHNGGHFDRIECLVHFGRCLPGLLVPSPAPIFLHPEFLEAERNGYRFTFWAGPPASGAGRAVSPSGMKSFAYVAVPLPPSFIPWSQAGTRAFCGDDRRRLCSTFDGTAPPVADGRCADPCDEVQ